MAWAPDYITLSEMKAFLRDGETIDDVQIGVAITAASRAIDRHTNRQFGVVAAAEERLYTGRYDRRRCRWVVEVDDFQSTTNLAVEVDGETGATYTKEPVNAAVKGRPWTTLAFDSDSPVVPTGAEHEVAVTALWGWTAVPVPVKQATYLQASRFLNRRDSPYGIAGSPDVGSEMRLLARLDPDVSVSLGPFIRWWAAV